ncbi:MAG: ATP-binding protein [Calditerrivibrio sp.]|nr:ATP-binding protein [Calditerrivibrio sp.]
MMKITTDIFKKLLFYSIIPLLFIAILFILLMQNNIYEQYNNISYNQISQVNKDLRSQIDFAKSRIPQRLINTLLKYGHLQDDIKYFIFKIKELYDIYIVNSDNVILDGESRFYYIKKGEKLNIPNDKFQIIDNDILIYFSHLLPNGQTVIYRYSIRKLFENIYFQMDGQNFFIAEMDGRIIFHTNPTIYLKNISIAELEFFKNKERIVYGLFPFPNEKDEKDINYVYLVRDNDLIFGINISSKVINADLNRIYIQVGFIITIYLILLFLIAKYLSSYISKPIVALKDFSNSASTSDTVLDISKFPDNELRTVALNLVNSFNTIKSLRDELYITIMSIGDGVIVTDESGNIELFNKAAEAITGYSFSEVIGKHISEIFVIHNEVTNQPVENPLLKALQNRTIIEISNNTSLKTKNGDKRIISDSAAPIIVGDEVKGGVLIFRDDTDKEKFKKEMIRKQQIETIGLVAGGIAHDFNNILSAINNYMLVARLTFDQNPQIQEFADQIITLCERGKFLSNRLLVLSKGGEHIALQDIDIYSLISETARFVLSGTTIFFNISKSQQYCYVKGDQNLIAQVFHNLLLNAKQAMPEGGTLDVSISLEPLYSTNIPFVKIVLKDNGPGIPQKYLDKVFQPFFTTKETGSGLGLYITKSIIEKHNGLISIDTQEGVGTTFTIYLPSSDKCPTPQFDKNNITDVTFNYNVLIMDDEYFVRDSLELLLIAFGCKVAIAENGDEAYELYLDALKHQNKFDLIFLDITVPLGKGAKYALEKIKTIDPDVKAVVMSGYTDSDLMEHYPEYGFFDFLPKPYDQKRLKQIFLKFGGKH